MPDVSPEIEDGLLDDDVAQGRARRGEPVHALFGKKTQARASLSRKDQANMIAVATFRCERRVHETSSFLSGSGILGYFVVVTKAQSR